METRLDERIRRGDRTAFEELVRSHYSDLHAFAQTLLRHPAEAEDVIQDVLLSVWERRADWHPRVSARAYLFAAVRNRAYNARRRSRRFVESPLGEAERPSAFPADEEASYRELVRDYLRAVGELPERRREVFRLSRMYGLSYEEIGVVLGISTHTVRSQIASALKHLHERLSVHLFSLW